MYWFVEDEFQTIQNDFMEKFYLEFEDTEENKFVYTDIHKQYVSMRHPKDHTGTVVYSVSQTRYFCMSLVSKVSCVVL